MPKMESKNELLLRAFADERPSQAASAAADPDLRVSPEGPDLVDGRMLLIADLVGCEKDDIEIEVSPNEVQVRAWTPSGAYRRTLPLMETVDPASAEARFLDGRLEVRLTPSDDADDAPRRIRAT